MHGRLWKTLECANSRPPKSWGTQAGNPVLCGQRWLTPRGKHAKPRLCSAWNLFPEFSEAAMEGASSSRVRALSSSLGAARPRRSPPHTRVSGGPSVGQLCSQGWDSSVNKHSPCLGPLLDSQERMCLGNPTCSHLPLQGAHLGRVDVQCARSRPRQCMSALTSKIVHEFLALHFCLPQLPSSLTWTPLAAAFHSAPLADTFWRPE